MCIRDSFHTETIHGLELGETCYMDSATGYGAGSYNGDYRVLPHEFFGEKTFVLEAEFKSVSSYSNVTVTRYRPCEREEMFQAYDMVFETTSKMKLANVEPAPGELCRYESAVPGYTCDCKVTEANIEEYVKQYTQKVLKDNVAQYAMEIQKGMIEVLPSRKTTRLDPDTLVDMLLGQSRIDVDKWEAASVYIGDHLSSKSKEVVWMWEYFHECGDMVPAAEARLSQLRLGPHSDHDREAVEEELASAQAAQQDLRRIFEWMTGWATMPVGAVNHLRFKFRRLQGKKNGLPIASTCVKEVHIPEFSDKQTLRHRFKRASYETNFERA
eukprot:TRINITY_DN14516_c0_g1_i1.p1 TRINITY_DN14516_c0_g1~~TRINITY_DN14516_c0_g1_i1.p1  ORF type:complete len:327 (+),score=71.40 TRINITY_DN14516_c0_g1_i1:159-1139(+)